MILPDRWMPRLLFGIVLAVYSLPFLMSLSLPFAYWDWLMTSYYQLRGLGHDWQELFRNILFVWFQDGVQFRPITAMIVNLQYLVFGGEFWLWYLTKWVVFAACVYLVHKCMFLLTRSPWASFAAAIYFALHPMPFVLDVISQDAYVVLFGLMALCWLAANSVQGPGGSLLNRMTNWQFLVFIVLCALASFSKEIGFVFIGAVLVFIVSARLLAFDRKGLYAYAALISLLMFSLFRIAQVHHPTSKLGILYSGDIWQFWIATISPYKVACSYLLPASPGGSLEIITAIIVISGSFFAVMKRRELLPLLLFAVSGLLGSIFVIASAYACPKYMPVPVMFFALLLGICVASLEREFAKIGRTIAAAFVMLICISAPAKIYSQWLGMMQSLYEMSDIINFMEIKAREGYLPAGTGIRTGGELPWEKFETFREFFKKSSTRWYGYDNPIDFEILTQVGRPSRSRLALLTSFSPADIAKGGLASVGIPNLLGVTGAYVYERERYGAFEKITGLLKRIDRRLGVDLRDPIDCQPPHPSRFAPDMPNSAHALVYFPLHAGPHFLYLIDLEASQSGDAPRDMKVTPLPPLRRYGAFGR